MDLNEIKNSLERSCRESRSIALTLASQLAVFPDACWSVVLGHFVLLLPASREVTFWGSDVSQLQLCGRT